MSRGNLKYHKEYTLNDDDEITPGVLLTLQAQLNRRASDIHNKNQIEPEPFVTGSSGFLEHLHWKYF